MKKIGIYLMMTIFLTVVVSVTQSIAGPGWFILGYAAGSSGTSSAQTHADSTVLYILPDLSNRIKNPLLIRMATTKNMTFSNANYLSVDNKAFGRSIYELFLETVPSAQNYELLQVIKAIDEIKQDDATIWFAYIEKDKVLPLVQEQAKKPIK